MKYWLVSYNHIFFFSAPDFGSFSDTELHKRKKKSNRKPRKAKRSHRPQNLAFLKNTGKTSVQEDFDRSLAVMSRHGSNSYLHDFAETKSDGR